MFLDIIVAVGAVWAFILGLRRGVIIQLCHLIGLYTAILLAPRFATEVGSLVMDDPGKAYLAGFSLIVAGALLIVWIIAPILRTIIVWEPIRPIDATLGGVLNLATMVVITASLFAIFDRINLGTEIRQEALAELYVEYEGREDQLVEKIRTLGSGDINDDMREFFYHKYVDYETLKSSVTFYPLARLGVKIAPTIKRIDEMIKSEADKAIRQDIFFEDIDD